MVLPVYTVVHVVISLTRIFSGFVVMFVLAFFVVLAIVAAIRFHNEAVPPA